MKQPSKPIHAEHVPPLLAGVLADVFAEASLAEVALAEVALAVPTPSSFGQSSAHESVPTPLRRIAAIVLPDLLAELASPTIWSRQNAASPRATVRSEPNTKGAFRRPKTSRAPLAVILTDSGEACATAENDVSLGELSIADAPEKPGAAEADASWDAKTHIDAVNLAARRLGVRPRQTIAEANAIVAKLKIRALPRRHVMHALKRIAEVALAFGSPVSFQAPDTIWLDVSGTLHLFESERALAAELVSKVRALGHTTRLCVADGPWLAQSFGRHTSFDETGVRLVASHQTNSAVEALPIAALPIEPQAVAWFARLGLLTLGDLRALPPSALASRLHRRARGVQLDTECGIELGPVGDLVRGSDRSVIIPHQPEELPFEALSWDDPLNDIEPLLFVLKSLTNRLAARLEGRGQAAREIVLRIHHERSIFASNDSDVQTSPEQRLVFRLATPLSHAEDLERIVRCRLQRERLCAPCIGLTLEVRALTRAHTWQLGLSASTVLGTDISTDPRAMAVLIAELAADIGSGAVGTLIVHDSHLLEKRSILEPRQADGERNTDAARFSHAYAEHSNVATDDGEPPWDCNPNSESAPGEARLPTRLFTSALELNVAIEKDAFWPMPRQPFVIAKVQFEERLEAVEWWKGQPIFRDYFRIWLAPVESQRRSVTGISAVTGISVHGFGAQALSAQGIEALAYLDRMTGKTYIQALYD